jgi:hypothetical protein
VSNKTPPPVQERHRKEVLVAPRPAEPPPPELPAVPDDNGERREAGPSFLCPFLNQPCVRERCMMWLGKEKFNSALSEAVRCAIRRGGEASLRTARGWARGAL